MSEVPKFDKSKVCNFLLKTFSITSGLPSNFADAEASHGSNSPDILHLHEI